MIDQPEARWPNFVVIGAAKSGTTSVYRYFAEHPNVFVSPRKEPKFFSFAGSNVDFIGPQSERLKRLIVSREADYLALFHEAGDAIAIGEASPTYLISPHAAQLMSKTIPQARLIAILRQPADRLYSAFLHHRERGMEPLSTVHEAVDAETTRAALNWGIHWQYSTTGYYYQHLRRFFDLFPPDQIRVVLYDDLLVNPKALMASLYQFVGVSPDFVPLTRERHRVTPPVPKSRLLYRAAHGHDKSTGSNALRRSTFGRMLASWIDERNLYPPRLDPETRAQLTAPYRDDILRLQELIARDLSHWISPS